MIKLPLKRLELSVMHEHPLHMKDFSLRRTMFCGSVGKSESPIASRTGFDRRLGTEGSGIV